jgi:hypothetical protein
MESLLGPNPPHDMHEDLVIIVGKGNRSEESIQVLRPTVEELLQSEFGIRAKLDDSNTGQLIVHTKSMKDVVARRRNEQN